MFYLLYFIIGCIISSIIFINSLVRRGSRNVPIDDIGLFFCIFLSLYTILPIGSWLLQGGQYIIPLGRLYNLQPTIEEVIELSFLTFLYIFGILFVYFINRQKLYLSNQSACLVSTNYWISNKLMSINLLFFLFSSFIYVSLKFNYGVYEASAVSYAESYKVYLNMPNEVAQLINAAKSINGISYMVLMVSLFMRWNKGFYRYLIIVFMLITFLSYDVGYSRTQLFKSILIAVLLFHLLVKPFESSIKIFILFLILLLLFLLLGIRGDFDANQFVLPLGEFDSIWGNAVDVLRERNKGTLNIPYHVYLYEYFSFIPSNLLPFPKESATIWYMQTYYPEALESGQGLAFGAIAQSVIGFGFIEAFLRGVVIGYLSLKIKFFIRNGKYSWWFIVIFLTLYTSVPNMARGSSLEPFFIVFGITAIALGFLNLLNKVLPSK